MAIKRKDFQKTSSIILEFLLKLPDEETSSRLRDTLLHGLHFLQQYYLILQKRDKEQKPLQWTIERGLSPLTPFREAPDKFEWPWIDVESNKVKQTIPKHSLNNFVNLSPIIVAVREGDLRYVKELLNSEPELIDRVDSFGRDLLTYAVQYQQIHILRYLLLECKPSANINIQANDGSTCLHRACYSDDGQQCNVDIVRLLLENNADVTRQDVHLRSPLHWAVLAENTDCLKILIEYNVDIHTRDADGMTPAMWACHLDRYDHFRELSRYMHDIMEKDDDGRTWIHHSVRKTEPLECLKSLLSSETMQLRDSEGRTCLHVAAEQGSVHACRFIFETNEQLDNPSYVHEGDKYRQTPLHLATKNGHARVLKELLDHGADPHLTDMHGVSPFDYAQNRGLYFCRSVFEVYMREKRSNGFDNQLSTTRSLNNNSTNRNNGSDVAPTPPADGRAKFIRSNNRRSLTESLPQPNRSSPALSVDAFSRPTLYPNSSSVTSSRPDDDHHGDDDEMNRQRYRPPSSTASVSTTGPPVKPRKSSTTPNSSYINMSKPQQNHRHFHLPPSHHHHVVVTKAHSDGDEDDEPNSLEGHGGQSDFDDDDQSPRPSRPDSRLSIRNSDIRMQQQQQQQSNANLRRPHYKQVKNVNRHSMYDDYRFLDEQQQQQQQQQQQHLSSLVKSKQQNRTALNKDFPIPSTNRIGSGSGNQSATSRLKSGSKSSSNESIPTLDLTVAGQKVFRTKQQPDAFLSNSLPSASTMRPPSGRLKPISSAKSTSSYTDELSSMSNKALEDVTNNVKQASPLIPKTHLYKKKLAPLVNSNDIMNKKNSYRSSIDQQPCTVDDVPSDRSEETSGGTSTGGGGGGGGGGGRDIRSSSGSDKRSKHH
ncbi:unnamed protein product [Rotaria socialis]|uniref:Uncharacterized protein n=1 Tax=Rotaria socialis TaxID=392032 RepID=A0A819XXJ5_9BILA|nr:unnamed protein product [Rotaria socialis]CAF3381239.1 unnamed protein product [Rotaria socialis]CAF4146219.1 unnamed protein product [Rotaria socialis]CAF4147990.1 unnamed protein product [Rotaria socialis]